MEAQSSPWEDVLVTEAQGPCDQQERVHVRLPVHKQCGKKRLWLVSTVARSQTSSHICKGFF